jgi:hypothetical protein
MVWPEPAHVDALVDLMRPEDREALDRISGGQSAAVLREGIARSLYCFTYLADEVPLCLGGIIDIGTVLAPDGLVWLVVQPDVERHKKRFLRESRRQMAIMLDIMPVLRNAERTCEGKGLRWLKWLGFEIGERMLINGESMVPITMRAVIGRDFSRTVPITDRKTAPDGR